MNKNNNAIRITLLLILYAFSDAFIQLLFYGLINDKEGQKDYSTYLAVLLYTFFFIIVFINSFCFLLSKYYIKKYSVHLRWTYLLELLVFLPAFYYLINCLYSQMNHRVVLSCVAFLFVFAETVILRVIVIRKNVRAGQNAENAIDHEAKSFSNRVKSLFNRIARIVSTI